MHFDPEEFGRAMGEAIRMAVDPLKKEIADLKSDLSKLSEATKEVSALRKGIEDLPNPKNGKDGEPGRDGKDCDMEAVKTMLQDMVKAIPTPKDGCDGKDGADGKEGAPGERGEKGVDGKDGAGIADLMIDRAGELVATFTDGRMKNMGSVIGKDGKDGKDGADFSNVSLEWDGERTLVIRGAGGEIRKTLPIPLDRGYWREGMPCEKGDVVTHDGNAWIALTETKTKPSHDAKTEWRMMARRGRDGERGPKGDPAQPDAPVKLGKKE